MIFKSKENLILMIDIHAHLCFPEFDNDRDKVIEKCKEELTAVIVGTARYEECVDALHLCEKHKGFLFPTLGFHPTEKTGHKKVIELIKQRKDDIVGIGEVGLDYHWEKDEYRQRDQIEVFKKFISLAEKLKKPLVIHSWDAEQQAFEMVKDVGVRVVFHSFSGKKELVAEMLKYDNIYISFSTQILFSKNHKKLAKIVPLNRMLLETDSPFLSPNKEHDRRNYPWNIKLSALKIAKLKGVPVENVLESAKENAISVFKLKGLKP